MGQCAQDMGREVRVGERRGGSTEVGLGQRQRQGSGISGPGQRRSASLSCHCPERSRARWYMYQHTRLKSEAFLRETPKLPRPGSTAATQGPAYLRQTVQFTHLSDALFAAVGSCSMLVGAVDRPVSERAVPESTPIFAPRPWRRFKAGRFLVGGHPAFQRSAGAIRERRGVCESGLARNPSRRQARKAHARQLETTGVPGNFAC